MAFVGMQEGGGQQGGQTQHEFHKVLLQVQTMG
jgi:hypothetical protein